MLILKIALGVIVGLVVGAGVLLLLARFLLKRLARNLAQAMGAPNAVPPSCITLDDTAEPAWTDGRWLDRQSELLREHGFAPAGDYEIDELPGVRVRGFVHQQDAVLAALTEHDAAGRWVDIVQIADDDACVTVTGAPPTGLATPSWKTTIREQGADADRLLELLLEQRDQSPPPRRIAPGEFSTAFETSYAREMDWMLDRGGPSDEEIREVARLSGQDTSPEAIASVRAVWSRHVAQHRDQQLRERFLATTDMPAAEWERMNDRLVFVHDQLTGDDLDELIDDVLDWEDEEACESICARAREARGEVAARQAFVAMNAILPGPRRYERVGQLTEPYPVDVYAMPMADATDLAEPPELRRAG